MSEHTVNIFEPQRCKICPGDSEEDTACLSQWGERNKAWSTVVLAGVKPPLRGPGRRHQPEDVGMTSGYKSLPLHVMFIGYLPCAGEGATEAIDL